MGLIAAVFFFLPTLLPINNSEESMKYVLYGISFCFLLLALFSNYRGKGNIRK